MWNVIPTLEMERLKLKCNLITTMDWNISMIYKEIKFLSVYGEMDPLIKEREFF
jgi:hypothetical protein